MLTKRFALMLVGLFCLMAVTASAQDDPLGVTDTVTMYVQKLDPGSWMISVHVWNDEELAAIDIPIKYTAGVAKLVADSVVFTGTRLETFEIKKSQVDTTGQLLHFGGFAYMSTDGLPMAKGNGEVGRVYISVVGDKQPGVFAVDTMTYPPSNKLMLVDANAAMIYPAVKIITVKDDAVKKESKAAEAKEGGKK